MNDEKICGTCKYHRKDDQGDWVCNNKQSDYYAFITGYADECEDWEER